MRCSSQAASPEPWDLRLHVLGAEDSGSALERR
eukprot:CAMPEP_0202906634 /NCGR_PEP_ID=MMETSP1392-20130828/39841_1 /ASSEMBLY_ACC=CAM_ASM_000868 /TAXON_ID=225041 /ORGANISM="Chlamydomonas chlamydogama, Strain SAG 11-48b" /LENGTH=32 /DNA_ID= /DNA_START= /DNA_END= /DNA_ORIENTATION=